MPGPAPDPNALRRDRKDDKGTWTLLPAEGRKGDPPTWPLPRPTVRERRQWEREWQRPQAVEWERSGQVEEVAIYVRTLLRCEEPDAPSTLLGHLLRQQEALGVSQVGLLKRRWRIEDAPQARAVRTNDPNRTSAKARFSVIRGEQAS